MATQMTSGPSRRHPLFSNKRTKRGHRHWHTFPDDDQIEHTEVGVHNASADRLAFALASTTRAVAGVSLAEQETHTASGQHTLLHGKALLVVSTADAHNIALQRGESTDEALKYNYIWMGS